MPFVYQLLRLTQVHVGLSFNCKTLDETEL